MIAVLRKGCPVKVKAEIVRFIENAGYRVQVSEHAGQSMVGVIGPGAASLAGPLAELPGVEEVRPVAPPYPLVSREHHPASRRVKIDEVTVGADEFVIVAGPCSVESREQLMQVAPAVAKAGARMLRGGAFKPRSSPYSFQGLGEEGLELLAEAREATGLKVVTEVLAPEEVELIARYADVLQIGARNTLDLGAIPVLKERTHLPVIVDPSHAAGRREWVPAMARACVAVGADGLIVEVHPDPDSALSDGRQSLTIDGFGSMMDELRLVASAVGRTMAGRSTG